MTESPMQLARQRLAAAQEAERILNRAYAQVSADFERQHEHLIQARREAEAERRAAAIAYLQATGCVPSQEGAAA